MHNPQLAKQILQGITRASLADKELYFSSFVPGNNQGSYRQQSMAKSDDLTWLEGECDRWSLDPGRNWFARIRPDLIVGSKEEYEQLMASKGE
jgi:hypothetical protein